MIVAMSYNDDGARHIDRIDYMSFITNEALAHYASQLAEIYEEVYITDFNPNCEEFINEIVTKGCRI